MNINVLSPYVRLAMHSTLPEGFKLNTRVIFDYELIYVHDGKCTITVNGVPHICEKNDVVLLRPGIPHSFSVDKNSAFVQPHIHFDAVYDTDSEKRVISFKNIDAMDHDELRLIQDDVFSDCDIPVVFRPNNISEFRRLFYSVINEYGNNNYGSLNLKSDMLLLIRLILEQFDTNRLKSDNSVNKRISAIKDYIDENFMSVITLDSLAEQFSMNKYTMLRKFKFSFGKSVIEYYNYNRVECAKKMLSETPMSIKEISELLNFSDEYSFSRFFKNAVNISPSGFRNMQ